MQAVGHTRCVEEVITFVGHARVPMFGVGIPGFAGKLIGIVYHAPCCTIKTKCVALAYQVELREIIKAIYGKVVCFVRSKRLGHGPKIDRGVQIHSAGSVGRLGIDSSGC